MLASGGLELSEGCAGLGWIGIIVRWAVELKQRLDDLSLHSVASSATRVKISEHWARNLVLGQPLVEVAHDHGTWHPG